MSPKGFLLTPGKLREYVTARGLVPDGRGISIRELGGGVSNLVFLVEGPKFRWVAKQSLEKLRVKDDWRSDRDRIYREAEAIQSLAPVVADSALPKVICVDRENYFFIMTAAPAGSTVWKESLLAGTVDAGVGEAAGKLLARIIKASQSDPVFQKKFADRTAFDQLRIDPYYRTVATRQPEVRGVIQELISDSLNLRTSLVHGDYSPKNMLVRDRNIFLIDFEVIHWGDPAFDAGFLLNHLFLKAFHQPRLTRHYLDAARAFWRALVEGIGASGDFEIMTLRHLGALMLARIDGKSPVEYIQDETTKDRVRSVAKQILLEKPKTFDEALAVVEREITHA